jgi:hypothetical protein
MIPKANKSGEKRSASIRHIVSILNAIFYALGNEIKWRSLLHDYSAGHVAFNAQNSNPAVKQIYILCADAKGFTHELFEYMPDGSVRSFESVNLCYP